MSERNFKIGDRVKIVVTPTRGNCCIYNQIKLGDIGTVIKHGKRDIFNQTHFVDFGSESWWINPEMLGV